MLNMSNDLATKIINRYDALNSQRSTWESHWREIDERVSPTPDYFGGNTPTPGEKRTERVFDSTATLALNRFAAAMESMLTPRTQRWHGLKTKVPSISEDSEVKLWLEQVTDLLFMFRYNPKANFASQAYECYRSLGKFGTAALFIDDHVGEGIVYKAIHLSELYIAENAYGVVDTVLRKFRLTATQAVQTFGIDNVPDKIKIALDKSPDELFEFIHAVYPNEDYKTSKRDARAMKFKSCYVAKDQKQLVRESGYRTMPYAVSRYVTNSNEKYGRSPAMDVLPDIKMLNEMAKTVIQAAHLQVRPPLMLSELDALAGFSLQPGSLNFGAVNENGQQTVIPLQTNANTGIAEYMIKDRRELINNAFLVTLFQILVETPNMTATEAMYRQQEKGALLAPAMGRQQSEMLGPMIERELDILMNAGMLPPMPEALRETNGLIDVEYTSPLNKAQKSEEGVAILQSIQALTGMAQLDPSVLKTFNFTEAVRKLADIYGIPASILFTPEQVEAMKQQEAQQQQLQQMLQAAPVLAGVSKDMAQAQSTYSQSGPEVIR